MFPADLLLISYLFKILFNNVTKEVLPLVPVIGLEKSRIDFDLGEETFKFETLNKIINEFIQQSHSISYQWITNEELDQKPELVRTLSVKPPRTNDKIRLVKIGYIDLQPCGGTHVANTNEIGEFKFIKYESKGKMNKRVQFTLI